MILIDSNVPMYLVGQPHAREIEIDRILSFDAGFDGLPKITRLY
jgi:predicted nucleic acid-binding protein